MSKVGALAVSRRVARIDLEPAPTQSESIAPQRAVRRGVMIIGALGLWTLFLAGLTIYHLSTRFTEPAAETAPDVLEGVVVRSVPASTSAN